MLVSKAMDPKQAPMFLVPLAWTRKASPPPLPGGCSDELMATLEDLGWCFDEDECEAPTWAGKNGKDEKGD